MTSYSATHDTLVTHENGLIREILCGRRDLFADLIGPHVKPLFHIIQRAIGQRQDVEDIVQQATLKALVHLAQFRAQASFRTWLVQIGLNEARQWQRGRAAWRYLPLDLTPARLTITDERHSPSRDFQRNEMAARLRSAAAKLPEKYRSVFHLLELEELSIAETARRLGLNVSTVKTRRMRARRRVARLLNHRTPARLAEPVSRAA
jgi:RNA polymerase sigma-70 factor (ECF subfamily)